MRILKTLLLPLLLVLVGCAVKPIPLNTVKYSGSTTVSTTKEASIIVLTGSVSGSGSSTMVPVGGIFIPIASGPDQGSQFHAKDQQAFGEALRSELVRLGVLKSASSAITASNDLLIKVLFVKTFHNRQFQQYTLDVEMEIQGGVQPFMKKYHLISAENESAWERGTTNLPEAKEKATKLLMERLIPDIEKYLLTL